MTRGDEGEEIDGILSSIREIMESGEKGPSEKPEEVLELTDLVQDDGTVVPVESTGKRAAEKVPSDAALPAFTTDGPASRRSSSKGSVLRGEQTSTDDFLSLIEQNAENLQPDGPAKGGALSFPDGEPVQTPRGVHPPEEASHARASETGEGCLSPAGKRVTLAALDRLRQTARQCDPSSKSLEEIVHEALHPILEAWLEKHLPRIVETVVEREIRALTSGYHVSRKKES
ncbi:MAG: DUF2497 domain-containing protein [Holosporales bacterium]|jgi:cell pole-organizing protein PopZ|nr:DUF2497 domain-containing protein [Holosporales bacterium]